MLKAPNGAANQSGVGGNPSHARLPREVLDGDAISYWDAACAW